MTPPENTEDRDDSGRMMSHRVARPLTRSRAWHRGCNAVSAMRTTRPRRCSRGFTLAELLIVVAMIGVLAALAMVGYRKYLDVAHTGEAKAIIGSIRNAEENYKSENLVYLGCSGAYDDFYPQGATGPNDKKWHFDTAGNHADDACWRRLGVTTDGPVIFAYAVMAGLPGEAMPDPSAGMGWQDPPNFPDAPVEPWFVVQATGNRDADTKFALLVSSSISGEIYSESEDE